MYVQDKFKDMNSLNSSYYQQKYFMLNDSTWINNLEPSMTIHIYARDDVFRQIFQPEMLTKISIGQSKKDVTPLLMH